MFLGLLCANVPSSIVVSTTMSLLFLLMFIIFRLPGKKPLPTCIWKYDLCNLPMLGVKKLLFGPHTPPHKVGMRVRSMLDAFALLDVCIMLGLVVKGFKQYIQATQKVMLDSRPAASAAHPKASDPVPWDFCPKIEKNSWKHKKNNR